jgi:hypothetical protein
MRFACAPKEPPSRLTKLGQKHFYARITQPETNYAKKKQVKT